MDEMKFTKPQIASLCLLHNWHEIEQPLDEFILSAQPQLGWDDGSLMVNIGLMWVGIQPDGSRHS